MDDENTISLIELTTDIVAAYVANNPVPVAELPNLIASVNAAINGLVVPLQEEAALQKPAVNPKKSVFPDFIICLEDGKKYKSMKRHLSMLGITPEEYRAKWNLPADYPMVAPNYSAARSALATSMGLGRKTEPPVIAKAKKAAGKTKRLPVKKAA
jgi:predicted transcriptional regulator